MEQEEQDELEVMSPAEGVLGDRDLNLPSNVVPGRRALKG